MLERIKKHQKTQESSGEVYSHYWPLGRRGAWRRILPKGEGELSTWKGPKSRPKETQNHSIIIRELQNHRIIILELQEPKTTAPAWG